MLAFTLLLVLLYGGVWVVFQTGAPAYRKLLAGSSEGISRALGRRLDFTAQQEQLVFRSRSRPSFEANLGTKGLDSNTPFLITLLLVTPGMSLGSRGWRMAAGLLLLLFSQSLFVVTKVEVSLIAAAHPQAGSSALWGGADNFFEITGKAFFPIMIWLFLGFQYMMGKVDSPELQAEAKAPGRNDPCPCGSGKKYKRCCGA